MSNGTPKKLYLQDLKALAEQNTNTYTMPIRFDIRTHREWSGRFQASGYSHFTIKESDVWSILYTMLSSYSECSKEDR